MGPDKGWIKHGGITREWIEAPGVLAGIKTIVRSREYDVKPILAQQL